MWVRPDYGGACFDALPGTVERLLTGTAGGLDGALLPALGARRERVVLVYLDAFGWELYERHRGHRLFARESGAARLTSQFPSTTTAHVTTLHSGLPVGAHGLYEWFVYEPSLNRLVAPLPFSYAGDAAPGTLDGAIAPSALFPAGTLYARLAAAGARTDVVMPRGIGHSPASGVLLAGAHVHEFDDVRRGAETVAARIQAGAAHAYLYVGVLDALMHDEGPESPRVAPLLGSILDALEEHLLRALPAGTLVLLAADHGMTAISPERTAYLNLVWPELGALLEQGADGKPLAPAGSPRDVFLHAGERRDEVVAGLAERLAGRARVLPTDELVREGLFGEVGDALAARLGDVAVLPEPGEAAYWFEPGRFVQRWRGMHGGLTAAEMHVPLVALEAS